MAKTKLRWEFPTTIETIEVQEPQMTVRNCLHGYDEQGNLRKVLYCTRDGRFYVRYEDGWHEQKPCTNLVRRGRKKAPASAGGNFDVLYLRNPQLCLTVKCYRLVAYSWCEHPEAAKTDPEWYKYGHGFEVDHLNGDHNDSSPENLQWVTTEENRRRAGLARRMRKIGLQPKWIFYRNLRGIFRLTPEQFEHFLAALQLAMRTNADDPLTIANINIEVAIILDEMGCKGILPNP